MKITICDDSIEDLLKIEELLLKYKTLYPGRNFELEKFSDPSRLSHTISAGKLSDIYILDMLMPKRTGIDLAHQIREAFGGFCFTDRKLSAGLHDYTVNRESFYVVEVDKKRFVDLQEIAHLCDLSRLFFKRLSDKEAFEYFSAYQMHFQFPAGVFNVFYLGIRRLHQSFFCLDQIPILFPQGNCPIFISWIC